jgi:hypothetical protein
MSYFLNLHHCDTPTLAKMMTKHMFTTDYFKTQNPVNLLNVLHKCPIIGIKVPNMERLEKYIVNWMITCEPHDLVNRVILQKY